MSKGLVIGIVAALVIILGGGYFFLNQSSVTPVNSSSTVQTGGTSSTPNTPVSVIREPGAPTAVTGADMAASNSTVVVTGTVTPNGASTSYWYEYGETNSLGSRTGSSQIGSGYTGIPAPGYITGLKANTTYYVRLGAQNRLGTVYGTIRTFTTTNNPPPPQGSVPTVTTRPAGDILRTTATLHGQVNPNNGQTTFWFEYGEDTDFGNITQLQSVGSGNALADVSALLTNLKPLTKYFFRLNAQNQYGTVLGGTMSFSTPGPAAPGQPAVTTSPASNITDSSARLNGRINPNGVDTDYWFEYSSDTLLGSIVGSVTATKSLDAGTQTITVSANVSGLDNHTKYFFRLIGRNQYGTVLGNSVSFTTKQ